MTQCNCKYFEFIKKGYNVLGHSYFCPLNPNYNLKPEEIKVVGDNPYKEVNRAKLENPYAKTEIKS